MDIDAILKAMTQQEWRYRNKNGVALVEASDGYIIFEDAPELGGEEVHRIGQAISLTPEGLQAIKLLQELVAWAGDEYVAGPTMTRIVGASRALLARVQEKQ